MITIIAYVVYLAISIAITVWVASTLYKNGRAFLDDAFKGNTALADSVNHLLVVGFYLVNLGYVSLRLKFDNRPTTVTEAIEILSVQIGLVLVIIGAMHFANIYIFSQFRKKALLEQRLK